MKKIVDPSSNIRQEYTNSRPKYWAGGFSYNQLLNSEALSYFKSLGHDVIPALPDPDFKKVDQTFTIQKNDEHLEISPKKALIVVTKPEVRLNISKYQVTRSKELIENIESHGTTPVDAIFQSADALNGILAMYDRPDLFHNVVLAYPAGIVKQRHRVMASYGVLKTLYVNSRKKHKVPSDLSFEPIRSSLRFPRAGGLVTIKSAAFSYQQPLLTELRNRKKNAPGVSIVVGTQDWMFRPELIIKNLSSANDVDYILVTNSPHGIRGRKDIMDNILNLFPKMERLKKLKAKNGSIPPLEKRIVFMDNVPQKTRDLLIDRAKEIDMYSSDDHHTKNKKDQNSQLQIIYGAN